MDPDSAIFDHPDRLPNIGNTCYINAVIQASTSSSLRPLLSEFPMVCPTSVDFEVRGDVLSELAQALGYDPAEARQHDAHECFCRWLELVGSEEYSPQAKEFFTGTYRVQNFCGACKSSSKPAEVRESHITLPLPAKSGEVDLQTLFDNEMSESTNFEFTCAPCIGKKKRVDLPAHKTTSMISDPRILVLAIKRFAWPTSRRKGWLRKIRTEVEFSRDFSTANSAFRLAAVIVHKGKDPYSGHYVAYTRDEADNWLQRDDELFVPCTFDKVQEAALKDGYLFFFERLRSEVRASAPVVNLAEPGFDGTPPPARKSQRLAKPGESPTPKPLPFKSPYKGLKAAMQRREESDVASVTESKGKGKDSQAEIHSIDTPESVAEKVWFEHNGASESDSPPVSPGQHPVTKYGGRSDSDSSPSSDRPESHSPLSTYIDDARISASKSLPHISEFETRRDDGAGSREEGTLPSVSAPYSPLENRAESSADSSPVSVPSVVPSVLLSSPRQRDSQVRRGSVERRGNFPGRSEDSGGELRAGPRQRGGPNSGTLGLLPDSSATFGGAASAPDTPVLQDSPASPEYSAPSPVPAGKSVDRSPSRARSTAPGPDTQEAPESSPVSDPSPVSPEYSAPSSFSEGKAADRSPSCARSTAPGLDTQEAPESPRISDSNSSEVPSPQKRKKRTNFKRAPRSKTRQIHLTGEFSLEAIKDRVAAATGQSNDWQVTARGSLRGEVMSKAQCLVEGEKDHGSLGHCALVEWESGSVSVRGAAQLAAKWARILEASSSQATAAPEIGLACFDSVSPEEIAKSHRCPTWRKWPPALRPGIRDVYRPLLQTARVECAFSSPEAVEKERANKCLALLSCMLFRAPVHDSRVGRDPGRKDSSKLPTIRSRLGKASRGEWADLLQDALLALERDTARRIGISAKQPPYAPTAPTSDEKAQRFCQISSLGAPAKARRMLDSAGILPLDPASVELLREVILEHECPLGGEAVSSGSDVGLPGVGGEVEQAPVLQNHSSGVQAPVVLGSRPSVDSIRDAVRSAPKATGAGRLGDRIEFWQILVASPDTEVEALAFLGDICDGRAHPLWFEFFSVVSLIALRKPNKPRPRPIGSPEPVYRLSARSWVKEVGPKTSHVLGEAQFAIGTSSGCEVYANAVRFVAADDPSLVWDKYDVVNAFGSISRDAMLSQAAAFSPGLAQFAQRMYASTTQYVGPSQIGEPIILQARRGVVQGDPLGPLLFCLGIQPCLEAVDHAIHVAVGDPNPPACRRPPTWASLWEHHLHGWISDAEEANMKEPSNPANSVFRFSYMDDIATAAPPCLSPLIPNLLAGVLKVIGLKLDSAQHGSYCPATASHDDGIILVGAPLGSFESFVQEKELPLSVVPLGGKTFLDKFNSQVIEKWAAGVAELANVPSVVHGWPSAHLAFQALQLSAQLRLGYHCRVSPLPQKVAAQVCSVLWEVTAKIGGLPPQLPSDHASRLQADLAIVAGGLGLRDFESLAPAAYLAAWLDALPQLSRLGGFVSVADFAKAVDSKSATHGSALITAAIKAAAKAEVSHCSKNGKLAPILQARDTCLTSVSETSKGAAYVRKNGSFKWQKFLTSDLNDSAVAKFRVKAPNEQEVWRQRASEPGAGSHSWLLAQPRSGVEMPFLENELFQSEVRARLRLPAPNLPSGATCRHVRKLEGSKGEPAGSVCGAPLDPHLHHGCICNIGGLVNARHDNVADGLAADLGAVGLHCDQEVWVPQWDQTKKQKDGTHKTIHARLDVRVLGPSGAVTYLDVRVFHPCSEKGKITNRNRPEAQEREKHNRYPTQGPLGERLHPFQLTPLVFNDLGGLSKEGWKGIQRFVNGAPKARKQRSNISAGAIAQAAALRVVRLTALLKRESLTGLSRGAVKRTAEGESGLGPEEDEDEAQAREESSVQEGSQAGFLRFDGSDVSRPVQLSERQGDFAHTRARVLNAVAHASSFQVAGQFSGAPGSALRWSAMPSLPEAGNRWVAQQAEARPAAAATSTLRQGAAVLANGARVLRDIGRQVDVG